MLTLIVYCICTVNAMSILLLLINFVNHIDIDTLIFFVRWLLNLCARTHGYSLKGTSIENINHFDHLLGMIKIFILFNIFAL